MHTRLFALTLAALGLVALDAQAGPTDTLKIARANVRSIQQGRLNLKLGLYTRSGRSKHRVEVYYVRGGERARLNQTEATFSGSRGGFESGVAVSLGRRNLKKAALEIVIPACKARKKDCVKRISLGNGANVAFDGRTGFERRGSDTLLKLKVVSNGLGKGRSCKATLKIDGKRHGKSARIPALSPGRSHTWEVRYPNRLKGKPFEAKLGCRDMVIADNVRKGRLK